MTGLLLRLAAPVQSWAGYRVSYTATPTHPVPTRSAVAGLVGACLGERSLPKILGRFTMRVRVDRANPVETDLQSAVGPKPLEEPDWTRSATIAAGPRHRRPKRTDAEKFDGSYSMVGTAQAGMARRDFLPFAEFVCELTTVDALDWLSGFRTPVFTPYLGRSGNPPTYPLVLGVHTDPLVDPLQVLPRVRGHDEAQHEPHPYTRVYTVTGDYDTHQHTLTEPVTPPVVSTRKEQLTWASQHLTR